VPPVDSVTGSTAAAGLTPPLLRTSLALTGTQVPCCCTRTGSALIVAVKVPFGLATVCDVLVVSGPTRTGRPVALARASAALDAAACGSARADPVCELSGPYLRATFLAGRGCAARELWLAAAFA
jgi:hypothetical protein